MAKAAKAEAVAPAIAAAQVRTALLQRYEAPEWHTETEFTLEGRRLDVFAMNRWGARSYRTVGFEIKVSRGDWRRELEDFRKSDLWTHVVDQFYVVAPGGIVDVEELPHGWGLLELRGSRMFTKRQALIGTSTTLPRELAARMVDRLCKRVSDLEWREKSNERAITAGVRLDIRRELEEELRKQAAPAQEALERDAARYRELMRDLGLGTWSNPVEILQAAIQIERSTLRIHENDGLRFAAQGFSRAAQTMGEASAELLGALDTLRRVLATAPTPEDKTTLRLPDGGCVTPIPDDQ